MTFVVNHLAPFMLIHLLLDLLKKSAPTRIVNVSSTIKAKYAKLRRKIWKVGANLAGIDQDLPGLT